MKKKKWKHERNKYHFISRENKQRLRESKKKFREAKKWTVY